MTKYLLAFVALCASALGGSPASIPLEARIYFANPNELVTKLGPLLGQLDVFTDGTALDGRHYLVAATTSEQLQAVMTRGLKTEVTWPSLRDKYRVMTGGRLSSDFGYFFNYYEMRDTIRHLALNYPQLVRIDSSMHTYEGRAMYCLKISDNPQTVENEPQVFINGVTHAREPMGCHACVAFATMMCRDYGHDSVVTWLVNNREIFIMPVLNADGYVYNSDVQPSYPYWRKNTNFTPPRTSGVDLNRNYGYRWGLDDNGSSPYPDDETYRGPSRFSEPETQVIRDFEAGHKFRTCMDFHTYGQYNLYAWGNTNDDPPEYAATLYPCGETLKANNGYYATGPTYRTIYPTNGNSVDWEQADTLLGGNRKFVTWAFSTEMGIYDFWYGENDPAYVDNEVAINIPNLYFLTRVSGVYLDPAGMVVNDTLTGNANGQLDPGEGANLWFKVRNRAVHALDTAKAVTAALRVSDTMVSVLTPTVSFPNIPRQSLANNGAAQFQVRCNHNATPGTNVSLRLEATCTDDNVTITQPVSYRLTVGNHPVAVDDRTPDYSRAAPAVVPMENPVRGSVRLDVTVPALQTVATVSIIGSDGSVVRRLPVRTATHQTVEWDCRNEAGKPASTGVYFARLDLPGARAIARFIVVE